jgi:predicted dehydrogenase
MSDAVRVGVIGCGKIAGQYLGMARNFPGVVIDAVADMNPESAAKRAAEFGIGRVLSVDQMFDDRTIEIILNLTIPAAHLPLAIRAIESGKHTYLEKPLGVDRRQGHELVKLASSKQLRVGCAPDTFMGAGIQTARKLIDDGAIGRPLTFTAFMMGRGHEHWHPSPEFYYQPGGGPMFDMGPYYLTALMQLLGPIKRVTGFATITQPTRTIYSEPKKGQSMSVTTPDHFSGAIEMRNGCVGTIVQSFSSRATEHNYKQPITIVGTAGTIRVPDPNGFDGAVSLCRFDESGKDTFVDMPHTFVTGYGRSVGLADMARAIRTNRPHRCSLEQSFAVLDAMQGFLDASESGRAYELTAPYERTAAMNASLPFGTLD